MEIDPAAQPAATVVAAAAAAAGPASLLLGASSGTTIASFADDDDGVFTFPAAAATAEIAAQSAMAATAATLLVQPASLSLGPNQGPGAAIGTPTYEALKAQVLTKGRAVTNQLQQLHLEKKREQYFLQRNNSIVDFAATGDVETAAHNDPNLKLHLDQSKLEVSFNTTSMTYNKEPLRPRPNKKRTGGGGTSPGGPGSGSGSGLGSPGPNPQSPGLMTTRHTTRSASGVMLSPEAAAAEAANGHASSAASAEPNGHAASAESAAGAGAAPLPQQRRQSREHNQHAYAGYSQDPMSKREQQVLARIKELKSQGLWNQQRLPKLAEPSRHKMHWDYLLDEMAWLSNDFREERKWKKKAAQDVARVRRPPFDQFSLASAPMPRRTRRRATCSSGLLLFLGSIFIRAELDVCHLVVITSSGRQEMA